MAATSSSQRMAMLKYFGENPNYIISPTSDSKKDLADAINAQPGPKKTPDQAHKSWTDWGFRTRKKYETYMLEMESKGMSKIQITDLESQLLRLIQKTTVSSQHVNEGGFYQSSRDNSSMRNGQTDFSNQMTPNYVEQNHPLLKQQHIFNVQQNIPESYYNRNHLLTSGDEISRNSINFLRKIPDQPIPQKNSTHDDNELDLNKDGMKKASQFINNTDDDTDGSQNINQSTDFDSTRNSNSYQGVPPPSIPTSIQRMESPIISTHPSCQSDILDPMIPLSLRRTSSLNKTQSDYSPQNSNGKSLELPVGQKQYLDLGGNSGRQFTGLIDQHLNQGLYKKNDVGSLSTRQGKSALDKFLLKRPISALNFLEKNKSSEDNFKNEVLQLKRAKLELQEEELKLKKAKFEIWRENMEHQCTCLAKIENHSHVLASAAQSEDSERQSF